MICSKCGYSCSDNDKFCIACGSPLKKTQPPVEVPVPAAETAVNMAEPAIEPITQAEADAESAVNAVEESIPVKPIIEAANPITEAAPSAGPTVVPPAEPTVVPAKEPVRPVQQPVMEPVRPTVAPIQPVIEDEDSDDEEAPIMSRLDKPLSVWGYMWRILLFAIPILSIIPLFIMAFSKGINKNSKHFATAVLIILLILLVLGLMGLVYLFIRTDPAILNEYINKLTSYFKPSAA